jgi:hypothetical protein
MKKIIIIIVLFSLSDVFAEQISSSVFGAGKEVSGGTYIVNGSAYQTHTGQASGTGYNMKVGFWAQQRNLATMPSLTTASITILGDSKAKSGGYDIDDGGETITAKGVCWNTSGTPTIADYFTNDGSGDADFESTMNGLSVNQQYYVRAYAINSSGTAYGDEKTFIYTAIPTLPEWGLIVFCGLVVVFAVRKIIKTV